MRSKKFGRIVNIGSINGQAGQYGQVNYAAAKSGIHGFTKALAQEGARFGITANAIAPGYVDTEMVRAVPPDVLTKIVARIPMGRLGHASDIARGVAFLTADDADFITGSTLSINGGQHMYYPTRRGDARGVRGDPALVRARPAVARRVRHPAIAAYRDGVCRIGRLRPRRAGRARGTRGAA